MLLNNFDKNDIYKQVVTLSVYAYFLAALIGAQMIPMPSNAVSNNPENIDLYFPVLTVLEVSVTFARSIKTKTFYIFSFCT